MMFYTLDTNWIRKRKKYLLKLSVNEVNVKNRCQTRFNIIYLIRCFDSLPCQTSPITTSYKHKQSRAKAILSYWFIATMRAGTFTHKYTNIIYFLYVIQMKTSVISCQNNVELGVSPRKIELNRIE